MKAFTTLIRKIIAATTFILALGLVIPVISGSGMTQVQAATQGAVKSITLKKGDKAFFNIKEFPAGATIKYKTSKKSVATVDAKTGRITAKKKGTAKITATVTTADKKSTKYTCTVKVTAAKKNSYGKFTEVSSVADFKEQLEKGGSVKLGSTLGEFNSTIYITGKTVLDLNGKMLRINIADKQGFLSIQEGASLTVIDSSDDQTGTIINFGSGYTFLSYGELDIYGGQMTGGNNLIYDEGEVYIYGGELTGCSNSVIFANGGNLFVNGGRLSSTKDAVSITGESTAIIDGGKVEGKDSTCFAVQGGRLFVNDGEFTSGMDGVYIKTGEVQINGGSMTVDRVGIYSAGGSVVVNAGAISSPSKKGYGLYCKDPEYNAEFTINGGKINSDYILAFLSGKKIKTVNINGGTIKAAGEAGFSIESGSINVKGGTIEAAKYGLLLNGTEDPIDVTVSKGTIKAEQAVVIHGACNADITGGTFKGSEYDLVIAEGCVGKINYNKKNVKKVYDATDKSAKNVDLNGYKRIKVDYKSDMQVNDVSTLYSLCCDSWENLTPSISIKMSDEMYAVLKQYALSKWSGPIAGYYQPVSYQASITYYKKSDPVKNYVITWNYGAEAQIYALCRNSKLSDKVDTGVLKYYKQINKILDSVITDDMTDREKIKAVHDYMCENYAYADPVDEETDHTFYAMLDDGTGVCQAYASLFHTMMLTLGIDSELVVGESCKTAWGSVREAHMWNKVVLDGKILYIDITWDDAGDTDKYYLKSEKDFYSDGLHIPS